MVSSSVKLLARGINRVLAPLGARVVSSHDWSDVTQFLPFERTISAAKKAGVSVADYVDATYNVQGATRTTIERMAATGVFSGRIDAVAEIGPGSGRYLEHVLRMCSPARYEIYETAVPWAAYLVQTYGTIWQQTDGRTMSSTADNSVDLVHAHKVFVATPFLTSCSYWQEMIRVVRRSAHIAFDIVTESCMDQGTLERWLEAGIKDGPYPAIMPRDFAIGFFEERGVHLVDSFHIAMTPGRTETFVFRKA